MESWLTVTDIASTHDVIVVADAGPHTAMPGLTLAQFGGPNDVPRVGVQRHHGGHHVVLGLLPQSNTGVQQIVTLHKQINQMVTVSRWLTVHIDHVSQFTSIRENPTLYDPLKSECSSPNSVVHFVSAELSTARIMA